MSWGIVESRVLKISPRWRDGNACTTSILRRFLAAAYTQMDAPLWGVKRVIASLGICIGSRVPGYVMAVCARTKEKIIL